MAAAGGGRIGGDYHAPRREAAAARRREVIVHAAKTTFEERGWSGGTIGEIADRAAMSPKMVEALFRTKAMLLRAAVEYAIRGDVDSTPMPERQRVHEIEAAPTAAEMLGLHARHLREVNTRSATIAWVVEQAAASDAVVGELWARMNDNRRYAVRWAARTLLVKPGRKAELTARRTEPIFWVALDWSTYRTLTVSARLSAAAYERWLRDYYGATLLAR